MACSSDGVEQCFMGHANFKAVDSCSALAWHFEQFQGFALQKAYKMCAQSRIGEQMKDKF